MKKNMLILLSGLILLTGCTKKQEAPIKTVEKPNIQEEPAIIEPTYVDTNPIKVSFYIDEGSSWHKQTEYYSPMSDYQEIEWFNIFLSDEEYLNLTSIKNDWNTAASKYTDIDVNDYRIGYEVSFKANNGEEFCETITQPKGVYDFPFYGFLYLWVYDDINATSSWYSHLEPHEYNENTWMSSIKFMSTDLSKNIDGPINVKVFTYKDEEDFDPETHRYRGKSESVLKIYKQ